MPLLHIAVHFGYSNMASILLKHNADPNYIGEQGKTALIIAAYNNDYTMTELLLSYDADKTIEDEFGTTPLALALSQGFDQLIPLLSP